MSTAKYANLPDIDTAQDVYETEDVEAVAQAKADDSADEDGKVKPAGDAANPEELDSTSLLSAKEAHKKFRKAEKRRARKVYSYPPNSDESSDSDSTPATLRSRNKQSSQFERLLALKQELALLEAELGTSPQPSGTADGPSQEISVNKKGATLRGGRESNDPAELLKGIHDVKSRLERIESSKEGRDRLLEAVVSGGVARPSHHGHGSVQTYGGMTVTSPLSSSALHRRDGSIHRREGSFSGSQHAGGAKEEMDPALVRLDSRVGELEKLIGSASAALDETSPLPPPLLPMLTKLNAQLTILTQPRTIDSISRRLKLLLTDMDRVAAQNPSSTTAQSTTNTSTGQARATNGPVGGASGSAPAPPSSIQEQMTPILQRLAPHLPTLPHILARLKTLSSLHAASADFQRSMDQLESQQARNRSSLNDMEGAIRALEKSMQENGEVEKANVNRLEANVQQLLQRLGKLDGTTM
ncbi:hypothetical protein FRC15_003058 [Serendipita sp. 397]|nr:hypothetical protein FRC15_003058 [Serendipita sp. 397]